MPGGGGRPGGGGGGGAPPASLYPNDRNILELTTKTFKRTVGREARGVHVWVLEFYRPSCGHCQQFAPELAKFAAGMAGAVSVGVVNCDAQQALCAAYKVEGVPTIQLLTAKGALPYKGARTAAGLRTAASEHIVSKVALMGVAALLKPGDASRSTLQRRCAWPSGTQLKELQDGGKLVSAREMSAGCVLVFSNKPEPSLLTSALSAEFGYNASAPKTPGFHFVHVHVPSSAEDSAATASLHVGALPAVMLLHGGVDDLRTAIADSEIRTAVKRSDSDATAINIEWPLGAARYTSRTGVMEFKAIADWLAAHQRVIATRIEVATKRRRGGGTASADL